MSVVPLSAVEKLHKQHDVSRFNSGNAALDDWLKRYGLINQLSDSAVTYVVHRARVIVGYYSLTVGSVSREESPSRIGRGLAAHPIGVVVLGRLAVDKAEQKAGLGKALLKSALIQVESAAKSFGIRAVIIDAIDEKAKAFYEHFNFEPSPIDPYHLMLHIKDLRALLVSHHP